MTGTTFPDYLPIVIDTSHFQSWKEYEAYIKQTLEHYELDVTNRSRFVLPDIFPDLEIDKRFKRVNIDLQLPTAERGFVKMKGVVVPPETEVTYVRGEEFEALLGKERRRLCHYEIGFQDGFGTIVTVGKEIVFANVRRGLPTLPLPQIPIVKTAESYLVPLTSDGRKTIQVLDAIFYQEKKTSPFSMVELLRDYSATIGQIMRLPRGQLADVLKRGLIDLSKHGFIERKENDYWVPTKLYEEYFTAQLREDDWS